MTSASVVGSPEMSAGSWALTAGVKGYLLKDSAQLDVVRAVQSVAQGRAVFSPAIDVAAAYPIRHILLSRPV